MRRPYPGYPKVQYLDQLERLLDHSNLRHRKGLEDLTIITGNVFGNEIIMNTSSEMSGITRLFMITSSPTQLTGKKTRKTRIRRDNLGSRRSPDRARFLTDRSPSLILSSRRSPDRARYLTERSPTLNRELSPVSRPCEVFDRQVSNP